MFIERFFLKRYRQKIKKLKFKYENILQSERNKYTAILNHDIKTPILAQNQGLELLLNGCFGNFSLQQERILQEIYYSNNFLLEIVTNSLFLAKYESENPKLKLEKIDIVEQIRDCCELVQNLAEDKQQKIIIKASKNNKIKLNADRKFVHKIIFNILSSSVSCGFEKSDIEISVEENKKSISFYAKNKSVYMTKEKIKSLLEDKKNLSDFNQLGMNLNLNIAQKLINAHNWDIIAKSNKDNTSVFGFVVKK